LPPTSGASIIAAVGYGMIEDCEARPFNPSSLRRLDIMGVLQKSDRANKRAREIKRKDEVIELSDSEQVSGAGPGSSRQR
jgi:hypothetical protein